MRVLLGIILGVLLTVGGTYLYDTHNAAAAVSAPAQTERPLVNWDVVSRKWHGLTEQAREEWTKVASDKKDAGEPASPPTGNPSPAGQPTQ
jgi:hypothetical protein